MEGVSPPDQVVQAKVENNYKEVGSAELAETFTLARQALPEIVKNGIVIDVKEEGNEYVKNRTFEYTAKLLVGEEAAVYAISSGTGTYVKDRPEVSGMSVQVGARIICNREGKGPVIVDVSRNANKTYIQVVELNNTVAFADLILETGNSVGDAVVRYETMDIGNESHEAEAESNDGEFRFLPIAEVGYSNQPELSRVIQELLTPVADSTHSAITAQDIK